MAGCTSSCTCGYLTRLQLWLHSCDCITLHSGQQHDLVRCHLPGRMSSVTTLWMISPTCSPAKGASRDTISHTAGMDSMCRQRECLGTCMLTTTILCDTPAGDV